MKIFKQLFLLLLALFLTATAYAQVTIGSGLKPKDGAILDLKQEHKPDGSANSKKGLGMPRVALLALDQLEPCAETNVANMKAHVGLMVYNTNDNTSTIATLREGMYLWDGQNWMPVGKKDIQGFGPWHQVDNPTLPARTETTNSYLNAKAVIGGKEILDDAQLSVYGNTVIKGQATVGSEFAPTRAALFELKEKQSLHPSNLGETESATSGGFLLPRVKLVSTATLEPFIPTTDGDWDGGTKEKELKLSLVGLMVYNVANVGASLYPGLYTWDGTQWATSQANPSAGMEISVQPKAFSFYETGEETAVPLTFTVSGAVGLTYQWYQVTGKNVHVRVGTPIGGGGTITGTGATSANFTPTGVIKGTTRNANNAGFYKFYCEATDSYGKTLQSDIAEVAVGCGAKNNMGDWLVFMCFNLGADYNSTIQGIKDKNLGTFANNPTNGEHNYIQGENEVYGDYFQWGRIADGHEKYNSATENVTAVSINDIVVGNRCSASNDDYGRPYRQITKSSQSYGKFIVTSATQNWNPLDISLVDNLWKTGRFVSNDPCTHFNEDGTLQSFWHDGLPDTSAGVDACDLPNTGWRIPFQEEWGAIYKGGTTLGTSNAATANTWHLNKGTSSNYNRGYEVQPDGATTTLYLPFSGTRYRGGVAPLLRQGERAYHWSTSASNSPSSSYSMYMSSATISPSNSYIRSSGFSIRCIKHE